MQPIPDVYHEITPFLRNKDVYSLMLTNKEISDISGRYLRPTDRNFLRAAKANNVEVLRSLLRRTDVDPTFDNNLLIWYALRNSNQDVILTLLEDPRISSTVDVDRIFRTAYRNGYTDVVRFLLQDPRIDPSIEGNRALRTTSRAGYTDIVRLLLEDPRVNQTITRPPFRSILRETNQDVVDLLQQWI